MNWEDINIQFGNTVRRLREGRGYSQEKLLPSAESAALITAGWNAGNTA